MKKLLIVLGLLAVLVGCGSSTKETTTVCSILTPYNGYNSMENTFTANGDKVTNIYMKSVLEMSSKEEIDQLITTVEAYIDSINAIEGVTASVERISDTAVYDIMDINLEEGDIQNLSTLGFLQLNTDSNIKSISLKQSVEMVETAGFTCKTQ